MQANIISTIDRYNYRLAAIPFFFFQQKKLFSSLSYVSIFFCQCIWYSSSNNSYFIGVTKKEIQIGAYYNTINMWIQGMFNMSY